MTRADELHETVEGRLRRIGQRYTSQRRVLVDALLRSGDPVSIPQLVRRGRGLPQSSVYRNLGVLEEADVVRRVITEEHTRFELVEDLTQHHHHLVCRVCGTVQDVTMPTTLERRVQRTLADVADRTGFAGVSHRLDLIGTCRRCG